MLFRSLTLNKLCVFAIAAVALSGCNQSSSQEAVQSGTVIVDPALQRVRPEDLLKKGLVTDLLAQQRSQFWEDCDRQWFERKREILKSLDERQAEIQILALKKMQTEKVSAEQELSNGDWITLGKIKARVQEMDDGKLNPDNWNSQTENWSRIYDYFKHLKKRKNQQTNDDWVEFNARVRAIMADDHDRLAGFVMIISKDSLPVMKRIKAEAKRCEADINCTRLNLDAEARKFLEQSEVIKSMLKTMDNGERESREAVKELVQWSRGQVFELEGRYNVTIRQEGDTLVVPMISGAFKGSEPLVEEILQGVFGKRGLKFRIEWRDSGPGVFTFSVNPENGERSYVSFGMHEVMLFNGIDTLTIAHEFGHVLGLPDRYYPLWHPETCSYETQSNTGDLMSDHSYGAGPTPADIQFLRDRYQNSTGL